MRSVSIGTQQRLDEVLDSRLSALGAGCDGTTQTTQHASADTACNGKVWAQVTASDVSLGGSPGLDTNAYGLLVGADAALGDGFHLGVEAGTGTIHGQHDMAGQGNRVRNTHAGVYAFANVGQAVLSATLDELHSDYRVRRNTGIGIAGSDPSGRTLSAGLQAAWPITVSTTGSLTPKVGVLYQHQRLGGFDGQVASSNPLAPAFGVEGSRTTWTSVQPYAGLNYSANLQSGSVTWVPEVELDYRYEARNNGPAVAMTAQDGTVFVIPGADVGRGMGIVKAGVSALFGAWSVYADFQGAYASHLHDNALSVGFKLRF